jgi:hypothetical protein
MENTISYLEMLTRETKKPEIEIMAKAFQIGLKQLWKEYILGRYLRNEISRNEAIESVGIDLVELAEHQQQAVMEDIVWAMEK